MIFFVGGCFVRFRWCFVFLNWFRLLVIVGFWIGIINFFKILFYKLLVYFIVNFSIIY